MSTARRLGSPLWIGQYCNWYASKYPSKLNISSNKFMYLRTHGIKLICYDWISGYILSEIYLPSRGSTACCLLCLFDITLPSLVVTLHWEISSQERSRDSRLESASWNMIISSNLDTVSMSFWTWKTDVLMYFLQAWYTVQLPPTIGWVLPTSVNNKQDSGLSPNERPRRSTWSASILIQTLYSGDSMPSWQLKLTNGTRN